MPVLRAVQSQRRQLGAGHGSYMGPDAGISTAIIDYIKYSKECASEAEAREIKSSC